MVLKAPAAADAVREGAYDSAWFAHRDDGGVTHVEIRGPGFKGSLRRGSKTLFRLPGAGAPHRRQVITEAPTDALSVAAFENMPNNTLYAATGGGMGPGAVQARAPPGQHCGPAPGALVAGATDANPPASATPPATQHLPVRLGSPWSGCRPAPRHGLGYPPAITV